MAIRLEISVNGGTGRAPGGQGAARVPPHRFVVAFDGSGHWNIEKPITPHWRALFGDAKGKWYKDISGTWVCTDSTKKHTLMEIRRIESLNGEVFFWPRAGNKGATLYDGKGRWKPSSAPQPKTWVGFAAKAGGGAGLGGEAAFCAVIPLWGNRSGGCSFATTTGRLGAVAGFSGGLALTFATGFASASEFGGFSSSGGDFALSFGPKIAGAVNPAWARMGKLVGKFDGSAELVEGIVKGVNPKYQGLRQELPGLAKSLSSAALIDPDEKNLTLIDVPLAGGGAELGIYYGWSRTRLLRQWSTPARMVDAC